MNEVKREYNRNMENYVLDKLSNEALVDGVWTELNDTQLIVTALIMDGWDNADIAEHLSISKQRLSQIKAVIREKLQNQMNEMEGE